MKEYKLKINDKDYTVVIKDVTDDAVLAEVNGNKHIVQIDTITSVAAQEKIPESSQVSASPSPSPVAIPDAPPPGPAGTGSIVTPIPGQIISISVSVGEKVRTGQKLLVLEAMKMENSITASMDGTVSEIQVAVGDVVGQGQTLIVLT